MVKIGGVQFVYNAISQDYCFIESIRSMQAACDRVYIVDAGSTDGTQDALRALEDENTFIYLLTSPDLWNSIKGPTKLSYFTNIAINNADLDGMDYILSVQADEVLHEDSIPNVRAAAEEGNEAYVFNRYNLFKDPYHMLNVVQDRKPCSTEVIRLAKSYRRAYSDAEHVQCATCSTYKSLDSIEIFHMSFVRDKKILPKKIKHVLTEVFLVEMDKRAETEEFQWSNFFKEEDLLPIPKALPLVVQKWAKERYPDVTPLHTL